MILKDLDNRSFLDLEKTTFISQLEQRLYAIVNETKKKISPFFISRIVEGGDEVGSPRGKNLTIYS